jgi:hypothetical protein
MGVGGGKGDAASLGCSAPTVDLGEWNTGRRSRRVVEILFVLSLHVLLNPEGWLRLRLSCLGVIYNGSNLFINSTIADLTSVDSTERKITVRKLAINKKKNDLTAIYGMRGSSVSARPTSGGDQEAT